MKKHRLSTYTITLCALLTAGAFFACTFPQPGGKVRVHGSVSGVTGNHIELSYDGMASIIGTSRNIMLTLDEHGHFDTTFYLGNPEYYRLNRNTLYLSPGDDLECNIMDSSLESEFKGQGADANEYMKGRLFPKAGSYIEAGRGLKNNFEETQTSLLERARERREQLEKLQNVSPEFKDLENARISADIINSYYSYPSYAKEFRTKDRKQAQILKDNFYHSIAEEVFALAKQIDDKKYLDVAVVRDVFFDIRDNMPAALSKEFQLIPCIKELGNIRKVLFGLRQNPDTSQLNSAHRYAEQQQDAEIRQEIEFAIQQVKGMYPGRDAFDLQLFTPEGKQVMLSQLKGRYLYIDFWATWCGPCCYESPFFEELSKKFDPDEILFIPISTDEKREAWLKYLKEHPKTLSQYNSFDPALKEKWNIRGIPRFVLIDKNFKIVNANAPRPSDSKTENYLKEVLLKQ